MEDKEKQNKIGPGNLKKVKIEYEKLRGRYDLPDFAFINENFEIEGIDAEETELFLKRMRKHMTEKIFFVLRSLEIFLHPQNAPLFMLNVLRSFSPSDKELVKELYKQLSEYEIEAFGLEARYDEKKEAEFVKKICINWKDFSEDLMKIYAVMKEGNKKSEKKQNKSYVG